jgi:hypothetical protein
MKYVTKQEVYEMQREKGIPEHSHINGLMTCYICINAILDLDAGWNKAIEQLEKDLGLKKE